MNQAEAMLLWGRMKGNAKEPAADVLTEVSGAECVTGPTSWLLHAGLCDRQPMRRLNQKTNLESPPHAHYGALT